MFSVAIRIDNLPFEVFPCMVFRLTVHSPTTCVSLFAKCLVGVLFAVQQVPARSCHSKE